MWPSQGHRHSGEGRNPEGRGGGFCHFHSSYVAFARPPSFRRRQRGAGNPDEGRGEEARHFHSSYVAFARPPSFRHQQRRPAIGRNPEGRGEEARHFHSSYVAFARPWSFRRRACPVPRYGAGIQRGEGRRPATFIPLCGLGKAMVIPAKSLPRTPIGGRNPEGRGEEARHFHSSYVAFARPWSFRRRACPVPRYGAGIQRGEGRRPAIFIPLMWPSQGHGHSGEGRNPGVGVHR